MAPAWGPTRRRARVTAETRRRRMGTPYSGWRFPEGIGRERLPIALVRDAFPIGEPDIDGPAPAIDVLAPPFGVALEHDLELVPPHVDARALHVQPLVVEVLVRASLGPAQLP